MLIRTENYQYISQIQKFYSKILDLPDLTSIRRSKLIFWGGEAHSGIQLEIGCLKWSMTNSIYRWAFSSIQYTKQFKISAVLYISKSTHSSSWELPFGGLGLDCFSRMYVVANDACNAAPYGSASSLTLK